jgi:hypothetical protein
MILQRPYPCAGRPQHTTRAHVVIIRIPSGTASGDRVRAARVMVGAD